MARARWLKPEFFTDAKVCAVSDQAALVFAALWVEADDGGVAPGDPRDIYGRRFIKRGSWSVEQVSNAMRELADASLALPFDHRGEAFVFIPDFARKQGIKPKDWRHLGAQHDEVTNAVLLKRNAVLLPSTPKPLAVAVAEAVPIASKGRAAPTEWQALVLTVKAELGSMSDTNGSILKAMLRGAPAEQVQDAIRGLGVLKRRGDAPQDVDLRWLWSENARKGLPTFTRCLSAYYESLKEKPKRTEPHQPERIGNIMERRA